MVETITATYKHDNDDWTITVSGRGKELTGKAPGIIAARDRADQLVEQLAPNERPTVVHLLNGNALEFTSAYMAARLTLPEIEPLEIPPSGGAKAAKDAAVPSGSDTAEAPAPAAPAAADKAEAPAPPPPAAAEKDKAAKPALPPSKQLPKEVEDRKPDEASRPGVTAGASATPPVARA
ncbi:hypothetical protein G3I59_31250 [Amycolatopsis rubida]|uniref:DUF2188 domain-containing protein n=1 Tax=Amycolatopsis rubida TaxID=112413 RepID=A0ABX0C3C4_9PSEU|nr:hypothetical protein [Amycolatopsis sp. M39]MYW94955.1 hypothetical protein [Amycolatopsis rubida]NEC59942.1 hypothetical protein [Amycolatopsis rubida]OAP25678.1 hypothetical protein A4R44_03053 [Amycolatopsis sp. M39]